MSNEFVVIEDNGGGLTLCVFDDEIQDRVIYRHGGYECTKGQLRNDIRDLLNPNTDIADFEGNEVGDCELPKDQETLEALGFTEDSRRNGGWRVVAEGETGKFVKITPWGAASRRELP